MNKKSKLIASILSITVLASSILTIASFGGKNIFSKTDATINNSVTFTKSKVTGTTSVSTGTTPTGGIIKCVVTNNDSSVTSDYVGALKTGTIIRFYEEDGTTEYTFEDVNSFSITKSNSTTSYAFTHYYVTTNGEQGNFAWSTSSTQTRTPNYQGSNLDVSQFWVECTTASTNVVLITSITINYGCTTKQQTGIVVDTAPTKTIYTAGEAFDPTGMLVKATYNNNTSIATTSFTYYPSVLSETDTFVTIYHHGFSTRQNVTVNSREDANFAGTYNYYVSSSLYSYLVINEENTGYYQRSEATYYFEWQYSSSSGLTITKTSVSGTEPTYGQIFFDSDSITIPNSDLTITDGELLSLKITVKGVSTKKQTFTK